MPYFGSNIVVGVAESWVEAETSWVVVERAGWSWVHGLVIPEDARYHGTDRSFEIIWKLRVITK